MDEGKISPASKPVRDREMPISEAYEVVGVSGAMPYRYVGPDGTPRG